VGKPDISKNFSTGGKEHSEEHWNHLHCPTAPLVQSLLH
jgi:hypothetical protein